MTLIHKTLSKDSLFVLEDADDQEQQEVNALDVSFLPGGQQAPSLSQRALPCLHLHQVCIYVYRAGVLTVSAHTCALLSQSRLHPNPLYLISRDTSGREQI